MPQTTNSIEGVFTVERKKLADDRGAVFHVMRVDSPEFIAFGETYVSTVKPGTIKAWKKHHVMHQSVTVPVGTVRFVIYDDRPGSPTKGEIQTIEVGETKYRMLRIPPGVWYGFVGIDTTTSVIVNCASIPHDPLEVERLPESTTQIPFDWNEMHGKEQ